MTILGEYFRPHLDDCRTRCLEAIQHATDNGNPVGVANASTNLAYVEEFIKTRFADAAAGTVALSRRGR